MESWKGNAKRGCGGWMEECGRGAAVEQLTARGMVSIPTMGAIENANSKILFHNISIPAMGAIAVKIGGVTNEYISIPAMGGNRPRLCWSIPL